MTKSVLSPRELASAIGVSESSVKRWVDNDLIGAVRTTGGHRRIPVAEAIRFVRSSHSEVASPEALGLDEVTRLGELHELGDEANALYEFLAEGRETEARGLVLSLFLAGRTVAQIVDGPLRIALERIGEVWTSDAGSGLQEHRATAIAIQAMTRLRTLFAPLRNAPVAVGGALDGDLYTLPSLCAATVLQSEGWDAVNLGADTPLDTLMLATERLEPSIVWLSVSHVRSVRQVRRQVARLLGQAQRVGATLIAGGCDIEDLELPAAFNLQVGSSMAELEALARAIRTPAKAS